MTGNKLFVMIAITTTLGILATAATAGSDRDDQRIPRGYVVPCSLDGVNPGYHPEVFGNPAWARAYGFVQSRDGSWHVEPNCVRGLHRAR